MTFLHWLTLAAAVLLAMALASSTLKRLPLSVSAIYLLLGIAIGPIGLGYLSIDLVAAAPWLGRVTEVAVILSLFIGGLKLRLPVRHLAWRSAFWLAGPVMIACIVMLAAFVHVAFGVGLAAALLLGAVLAPTDPVLASLVSVSDAQDYDRVRYALSGEAGLNDGTAFPFVVLALMLTASAVDAGEFGQWALHRLLYAVPASLALGFYLGRAIGQFAIELRSRHRDAEGPNDLLALALIALAYVTAEAAGAWGFLAVFAAGVGLRAAEIKTVLDTPHPEQAEAIEHAVEDASAPAKTDVDDARQLSAAPAHPPAESLVSVGNVSPEDLSEPAIAAGTVVGEMLSFGATAERLIEVALVVLVGCAVAWHWDWRAIPIAAALFLVIRPLAVMLFVRRRHLSGPQRALIGWFGIRGIGSLYYVCYALTHGYDGAPARELVDLTVSVIAISIFVHGASARPILSRYERWAQRRFKPKTAPAPGSTA